MDIKNKKTAILGLILFFTISTGIVFTQNPLALRLIIDGGDPGPITNYEYAPYDSSNFEFEQQYFGDSSSDSAILDNGYFNKETGKICIQGTMQPSLGSYSHAGFSSNGYIGQGLQLSRGKSYTFSSKILLKGLIESWAINSYPGQYDGDFEIDLTFKFEFYLYYRIYGDGNTYYRKVNLANKIWSDEPIPGIKSTEMDGDSSDANTLKYQINQYFYPSITFTPGYNTYGWGLRVSLSISATIHPSDNYDGEGDPKSGLSAVHCRFLYPGSTTGPLSDGNFKIYYFKIVQ